MAFAWPALPSPGAAWRARWRRWWWQRLTRTDSLTLTQRNVYILPTRAGWMLALTLMVLLVASINYQLNLGYALTFLLAGSAVAGMHVCHGTLRGLGLHLTTPQEHFARTFSEFGIKLVNARGSPRLAIGVAAQSGDGPPAAYAYCDLPAGSTQEMPVGWTPPTRGWHDLPMVTAETRFPLGTFRVWTYWRPATRVLVYPAPESPAPALPSAQATQGSEPAAPQASRERGEIDGVRPYERGDGLRQIAWRKSASALAAGVGELTSRHRDEARQGTLWLDWADAHGAPDGDRAARLCAWVITAHKLDLRYGLRVPGREVAPSSGDAHRRACLEALALC